MLQIFAKFVIETICFCVTLPLAAIHALRLEKHTLGLFPVELDVLDDKHPDQGKSHHSSAANNHVLLGNGVCFFNRKTGLSALGIAKLYFKVLVDAFPIGESICWQVALQRTGKSALPDCSTDRSTNGATNVAEHTQECQ